MSEEKLVEVKRCSKCGWELPKESKARACPYCGGTLIKLVRRKEESHKHKEYHHAMPSGKEVPIDKR